MVISRNFLEGLATRHHHLKTRYASQIEKGERALHQVGKTLEISGAAFVTGAAHAKLGGVEVFGVPVELLAGVAAHGAGFFLVSNRNAHHAHYIGDGILAAFAARMGQEVGQKWKSTGKLFGHGGAVRGLASGTASDMSDADLARLAAAI